MMCKHDETGRRIFRSQMNRSGNAERLSEGSPPQIKELSGNFVTTSGSCVLKEWQKTRRKVSANLVI